MNAIRLRTAALLLTSLPLCACASTPQVRQLANNTGVFVQSLNTGTARFVEAQNWLNASNQARLARLEEQGETDRTEVRQQRLAWTDLGANARLATHDLATGTTANEIVQGLTAVTQQPARIENGTATGYAAAATALADAGTTPRPLSVLGELLEFGQQVVADYEELGEKAEEAGAAGADAAASADSQSTTAAQAAVDPK